MSLVIQTYGHQGINGGEPHVADLLRRTVEGQWSATESRDETLRKLEAANATYQFADLSAMSVLQAQQCAAIRWQLATAFVDGIVEVNSQHDALPGVLYTAGDDLCDAASLSTRNAIELKSRWEHSGRVQLAQHETLRFPTPDQGNFVGVWRAAEVAIDIAGGEYRRVTHAAIPIRLKLLFDRTLGKLRPHFEVFNQLRKEWRATSILSNQLDLARDAVRHAQEVFELAQLLWAPYLHGAEYHSALKRKLTMSELNIRDPWILTDPRQKAAKQHDAASVQQLADFWQNVADIDAAANLAREVYDLLRRNVIRRRTGRGYALPPWSSQFIVRYPVTIGAARFNSGDLLMFFASSDDTGQLHVQARRAGKLTKIVDLLGISPPITS